MGLALAGLLVLAIAPARVEAAGAATVFRDVPAPFNEVDWRALEPSRVSRRRFWLVSYFDQRGFFGTYRLA
jgi:hypothetical protein